MQGVNLPKHNMSGLVNRIIVTASVKSDLTEVVGSVPVAPPSPSLPCKGERSGGPTTTTPARIANESDNGQTPATLVPFPTKNLTTQYDNVPLRLRGGNGDLNDESIIDMDIDTETQADAMNGNPIDSKPAVRKKKIIYPLKS